MQQEAQVRRFGGGNLVGTLARGFADRLSPLQFKAFSFPGPPMSDALTAVAGEAARRRTFAIISHPDAGKTTLTEKLLLFSGAIQ